jgi:hypothetical protein
MNARRNWGRGHSPPSSRRSPKAQQCWLSSWRYRLSRRWAVNLNRRPERLLGISNGRGGRGCARRPFSPPAASWSTENRVYAPLLSTSLADLKLRRGLDWRPAEDVPFVGAG